MMHLVMDLVKKAKEAATVEAARAFAEAAIMVNENSLNRTMTLVGFGEGQKIAVIKVLRERLHVGLKEAKDISEALPYTLPPLSPLNATLLTKALQEVSGRVEVR